MKQQHFLMQGVELVVLGQSTIVSALKRVTGCAACTTSASRSFESLLNWLLGANGMTEYLLSATVECPRCTAPIFERTLIDFDGKAKAALDEYAYFDVPDEDQDVIFIDESTLLDAESFISACEYCSDAAEIPFDQLLDSMTGCDPSTTEYVICHAAKCGACRHDVMEKTLIQIR